MKTSINDVDKNLQLLEDLGDPLPRLQRLVDWELFSELLNDMFANTRKCNAGRKPYDFLLMFKLLVLQHLYNLSDEQTEYQIQDRYSFRNFLGLGLGDRVPDARTVWLFKDRLKKQELDECLFVLLERQIKDAGFFIRKGHIVDARFVRASRRSKSREQNAAFANDVDH